MRRPRFQFRLRTLMLAVTISAIGAGMLCAFWGNRVFIWVVAAGLSVAGFAFMVYGARMTDVARGATWPVLLAFFGFLLIAAAMCSGIVNMGIE